MGWTKQQLIEHAFEELALAGYVFDLGPDELQSALRRLDAMMAAWSGVAIAIGYSVPASPAISKLDDDSGLPDGAGEAVFMNLAVRLAASRGKALSAQTLVAAKRGYDALLAVAAAPTAQQASGLPLTGAGNKPWRHLP